MANIRWLAAVLVLGALGATGCSGSSPEATQKKVQDAKNKVQNPAQVARDNAAVREAAEGFATRLRTADQDARSMDAMRAAVAEVPTSVEVSGILDGNGDGRDDDGKVQFQAGDAYACVAVNGNDVAVDTSRC